jgi:hypothetical protein
VGAPAHRRADHETKRYDPGLWRRIEPVRLQIFDLRGRLIRTLVEEHREVGRHEVVWSGFDDAGSRAASGVYVARLATGGAVSQQKIMMVK